MLRLHLLGTPQIFLGDDAITIKSLKAQALLYYVAMAATPVPRHSLTALLWPDSAESTARSNLRTQLTTLRNTLKDAVIIDRRSVGLAPSTQIDATHFLANPAQTFDQYRGDFLSGFSVVDSAEFEHWLLLQRENIRLIAIQTVAKLATNTALTPDELLPFARQWVALAPFQEGAYRCVMELLAQLGERSEALVQFEICRRFLNEELDVGPSIETHRLAQRIKAGEFERFQGALRNNLPALTTKFVGRSAEIDLITRTLTEDGCRLLTLHGPGGMGKSRLALQSAHHIMQSNRWLFQDGIFFAPLESTTDLAGLVSAFAGTVGCFLKDGTDKTETLLNFLEPKHSLVILDNFEQLTDSCAAFIATLLKRSQHLTLLVTSRQVLDLYEETQFSLAGLPTDWEKKGAAQELFLQRAKRVNLAFVPNSADKDSITSICKQVDGLPLAVEMAAAWTSTVSCNDMLLQIETNLVNLAARAKNRPNRHTSLLAVFESSWSLLTATEKAALTAVTVFQSGFDLRAARSVANIQRITLKKLADHALVQPKEDGRFDLHPVIREFAAARSGQKEQLAISHANYFLNLLKLHEKDLDYGSAETIKKLQPDRDNLLLAWQRAIDQQIDLTPFNYALMLYANTQGIYAEGRKRFLQVPNPHGAFYANRFLTYLGENKAAFDEAVVQIEQINKNDDPLLYADYLSALGANGAQIGKFEYAIEKLVKACEIFENLGETQRYGSSLANQYIPYSRLGLGDQAIEALESGLAILKNPRLRAGLLNIMGQHNIGAGDYAKAIRSFEESERLEKQSGNMIGIGSARVNLSIAAHRNGDFDLAEQAALAARKQFSYSNSQGGVGYAEYVLGAVARGRGDSALATSHYKFARSIFERSGNQVMMAIVNCYLGMISAETGDQHGFAKIYQGLQTLQDIGLQPYNFIAETAVCFLKYDQVERAARLAHFAATGEPTETYQRRIAQKLVDEHYIEGQHAPIKSVAEAIALCHYSP